MLVRIVRMVFREDAVGDFLEIFEGSKTAIRNFDGCRHLELMKDENNPSVFYTYSHWVSEDHLDEYRHSELFEGTWSKTKLLFADKPQAFSLKKFLEVAP
ncbi:MAG: antibiotic biosynthesis monooxygenase family protein [Bacteroidota bacterium]